MFGKVLFTGLAIATLALAQGSMGGGGGGMGGGGSKGGGMGQSGMGGGGGGHQQKESKAEQMISRLKLSGDQKSEFITIMDSTAKDADSIVHSLLQARQSLANAMIQGKSEADLAPLVQAANDAQFQMTGVEVKTMQKIMALLKPNQISKIPEAFDLMADIFLPQGGGGGGRRGGGGQGQ